jgi:hypothetical protein
LLGRGQAGDVVASYATMGGFQDGGDSGGAGLAEVPRFRVWTVANTRRDHRFGIRIAGEFERGLAGVPWFGHLGERSPWDDGCVRISGWEQWPGPENALGEAFGQALQDMHDRIFAACPAAAGDLRALFDGVRTSAVSHARVAVPFDPGRDAWHAPTQCVHAAGYTAALIACVLACGWPVPEDLAEMWNWFETGHWPSGFADEPGDVLVSRSGRQLVFPRRLLVY